MTTASDFDRMVLEFMRDDPLTAYYQKITSGDYNPVTSSVGVVTTEIPVSAILLDLTLRSNGLTKEANSLIQAGDKLLFVRPPNKADPDADFLVVDPTSDRIRIGSTVYTIVTFKEVNPSAQNQILIELYIRQ